MFQQLELFEHRPPRSPAPAVALGRPDAIPQADLQARVLETGLVDADFVGQFFSRWPPGTMADEHWLRDLTSQHEAIRLELVRGDGKSNQAQVYFHLLCEQLGELCGPLLAGSLARATQGQRLQVLRSHLGFGLRPSERQILANLCNGRPGLISHRVWVRRGAVEAMGERLGLKGLLLVQLTAPNESNFCLEPMFTDPGMALARAIREARRAKGLSQRELARLVGIDFQQLHHFEHGRHIPGHESQELIERLVHVLDTPAILAAFHASSEWRDRQKPHARSRDVFFADFLSPTHDEQLARMQKFECARDGVSRGGKRQAGGRLATNSMRNYRQLIARVLTFCQLAANPANARLSGLGLPADEVSILDAGHPPFLEGTLAWLHLRTGRAHLARGEGNLLGKLIDLFSPKGFFYSCAEELARILPAASLARCPATWPAGSDQPGITCRSDSERIRARCREVSRFLLPMQSEARNAAPARDTLRDIVPAMRAHFHLLEAPMTILARTKRLSPRSADDLTELQARAMLAVSCRYPVRPETLQAMRLSDVIVGPGGHVEMLFHPNKNGRSFRAQQLVHRPLPRELASFLLAYLELARPRFCLIDGSPWLFLNPDGGQLSDYHLARAFNCLAARYAPELFPDGLRAHRMRSIVATDLVTRFGRRVGTILAADALVDHECTITRSYVLREPDPEWLQVGDASSEAAVRAAWHASRVRLKPPPA